MNCRKLSESPSVRNYLFGSVLILILLEQKKCRTARGKTRLSTGNINPENEALSNVGTSFS